VETSPPVTLLLFLWPVQLDSSWTKLHVSLVPLPLKLVLPPVCLLVSSLSTQHVTLVPLELVLVLTLPTPLHVSLLDITFLE
jgi:hypothetical protein